MVTSHYRESAPFQSTFQPRARWILGTFLFTFIVARVIVFLILTRRIPDIYLHLGGPAHRAMLIVCKIPVAKVVWAREVEEYESGLRG